MSRQTAFWQSEEYKRNGRNRLQEENAKKTLEIYPLSKDVPISILDIGCGVGNITAFIAKTYPKATVLGLDLSESMIEAAKRDYPASAYPNLAFVHSDIVEYSTDRKFDAIVSFNCLHWVPNLSSVIKERIMPILKPRGNFCFMLYPRVAALWDAIDFAAKSIKWSKYFPNYRSPYQDYQAQGIESMLVEAGFENLQIIKTEKIECYEKGISGLKEYIWGFLSILSHLPSKAAQSDFLDNVMQKYIVYEPVSPDRSLSLKYTQLDVSGMKLSYLHQQKHVRDPMLISKL